MKEFLKKYTPKHYKHYQSIVDKRIGNEGNLNKFVKGLGTPDILVWLKSISLMEEKHSSFFEEGCILTTFVIRILCLELDVEIVELKNSEIIKLIERFEKALKLELAYRKDVIDSTPNFTILKDFD